MKQKILELLKTTAGQLIFALISGCAYFMILLRAIVFFSSGKYLLGFYFAPAIICGAALLIIKMLRQARENENDSAVIKLFTAHIILFFIAIVFAAAMIKG